SSRACPSRATWAARASGGLVALGRLHLDHLGAEVGEHHGRRRHQHHRGRLHHADPLEQHRHVPPSSGTAVSSTMSAMRVERPSVCPLDCPDTCSLTVTVEDDRIVAIRGSHANPYTGGVLCAKVPEAYPAFVYGAGRLRTPLRRVGDRGEGRFERITWGEALDLIHARFTAVIDAHGPQAILPLNYAGAHGMLAWGVAAELERRGGIDRASVERHVAGFDEFMALARGFSLADAARVCGVNAADVRTLAEWYGAASPAAISVGNGLERNQNGGSGIRAIFALPALAGKFGVPGGGLGNGASF